MRKEEIELKNKQIIENYQEQEETMVLIFAQWCVNQGLDAFELYEKAYPGQLQNKTLKSAYDQTVPKEEAEEITDELLLQVLDLFGNHDLAFIALEMKQKSEHAKDSK